MQGFLLQVEVAEIVVHEACEPDVLVDLFDTDILTGEHEAEIDLLPVEADAAAGGDGDGPVMERRVDVRQALIVAPEGR